ncbi:stage V sporulation protein B [Anaerosolibacter carboniphilus]|uniref:Stage V sporulation protein B n=1 Tax=Anaerosolibacter carboniphilus TaxID=1417629 RepID=A0A841KW02_9FIRM|nr:polysaccharide biosynthesis protein [Anaerosolibacter carboniphilus]MBB6217553.1 stage V sporulation protein B [Anaerosolibacter carboniphilus]
MKKILVVNTFILMGTSLLLRTVGISFRVYISNKIGAEGMGLYQLILSIYMLASTFATSGISTAVTRLVAEERGRGTPMTVNRIMKKALTFSAVLSTTVSVLLFIHADYIGRAWLHDPRTIIPLKILGPSLPFIGLSSCLRGYFYGVRKVIKPASAQILEEVTKIFIIVHAINIFIPRGLEYACAAVVVGTTAAEIASCGYMLMLYQWEERKCVKYDILKVEPKGVFKRILNISLPVAASSYIRSGLKTVENIMIPAGFEKFGASNRASLAEYGMVKGMAMPILTFPSVFLSAFSTLLVPEISEARALNHTNRINYAISRVFQLTLLLAILVTGIFVSFSKELGMVIYKNEEIGILLKLLAPLVPFMYLDRIADGMLKGLNQQMSSLKYNTIDSLTRIGMIYYFIPMKGVTGFIIVIFISNILNSLLSIGRLLKVTRLKFKTLHWIVMPMTSIAASGFLTKLIFEINNLDHLPMKTNLTIGVLLICILYVTFLILVNGITKEDIHWFKNIF